MRLLDPGTIIPNLTVLEGDSIDQAAETVGIKLPEDIAQRFPHKQEWMNKYLGILIVKLRPLPGL